MKTVIIIPARYDSSRFPGKPLAKIKGQTLLYRMWSLAKQVQQIDEVYIATDHPDIAQHATAFGARVVSTGYHPNGTERVFAAATTLGLQAEDYVINLQGDAVLTPPWVIQALVDHRCDVMTASVIHTLAVQMAKDSMLAMQAAKAEGGVGGTTVVFDKASRALYFSKSMIPFLREIEGETLPCYRHIGLYAYSMAVLEKYVGLPPSRLEKVEGLEQLRALENQIPIHVTVVDYRGRTHASIDSPSDVVVVEQLIEQESELISFSENKGQ